MFSLPGLLWGSVCPASSRFQLIRSAGAGRGKRLRPHRSLSGLLCWLMRSAGYSCPQEWGAKHGLCEFFGILVKSFPGGFLQPSSAPSPSGVPHPFWLLGVSCLAVHPFEWDAGEMVQTLALCHCPLWSVGSWHHPTGSACCLVAAAFSLRLSLPSSLCSCPAAWLTLVCGSFRDWNLIMACVQTSSLTLAGNAVPKPPSKQSHSYQAGYSRDLEITSKQAGTKATPLFG